MARQLALRVLSTGPSRTRGVIELGPMRMPCALGRAGIRQRKREGDGGTPAGQWRLITVFYRPDRRIRPSTGLPVRPIGANDGWCDAPGDRNYNRAVRLPYPASHEKISREDSLYDIVVVLDYNIRPRRRGAGSAIFMHVARPGYMPTEGCIALKAEHLARLLTRLRRGSRVIIR